MRSGNEESEKGAEEVEDDMLAWCLSFLRSHPTPHLCDEPGGLSLLSSKGAGMDGEEDMVASDGGHIEAHSRSRQQSTRDGAVTKSCSVDSPTALHPAP